jgi:5-methylcytosine-specific restriction enzyme subunit McrC
VTEADPITIQEYSYALVDLSADTAALLAAAAKDRLRVSVDGSGMHRVEAMQYVGSVVVPGASVLIRPKIDLENVFLLLEAVPEPEWRREDFMWDAKAGLLPAFAAFFARTLERVVARGLYNTYREEQERIPALRGRLDVSEQLRQPGILVPVPCRFDEFTVNVIENQALKSALLRLTRVAGVPIEIHRRLRRLRTFFEDVSDELIDAAMIDRIVFHRLNERYRPALRLAALVLRNTTLADQGGDRNASSFLIDMNQLFQSFVTQRLRRILRGTLDVVAEPGVHLAYGGKVRMAPDLVFNRLGSHVFVGDTKYKLLGDQLGRDTDYYQMLAYTTALDLPEGALIYCSAEGDLPDRVIEVVHAGKRLWTYPLDLSGTPRQVDASLVVLAEWITRRSRSVVVSLRASA